MVTPIIESKQKTVILNNTAATVTFISNLISLDLRTESLPVESIKI